MPAGIVQPATPVAVMPLSLSRAFVETRSYGLLRANEYADGSSQRSALLPLVRRSWQLAKRLPPDLLDDLRTFWIAQGAGRFYFYNPMETSPPFSFDGTGAATTGRYAVRFASAWDHAFGVGGMSDVSVEIVQVFRRSGGSVVE